MTTVLDEIESSLGWTEVPLRAVGVKVSDAGYPNLEPLSVFLDAGVVPRSSREDNHNQLGESLDKYQRVQPNDLVFNKLRTWQGGFGISDFEGIVSPAYIIVRLNTEIIHPKFLEYLLKSKPYLAELTRLSKWMPPTQFDISWESLRDLQLRIPPIEAQRRIADLLDEKIPKISKVIDLKVAQLELVKELFEVLVESHTSAALSPGDVHIALRRVCKLDPDISIPPEIESEVTFLGLEDVQPGNLANFERLKTIYEVMSGYSRFIKGDILLPKVSPSFGHGRAVVADNLKSKVGFASTEIFTIRSDEPNDNSYLCLCLRSRDFLRNGESSYLGVAGVKRVDKEVLLDWKIRWPQKEIRSAIVQSIAESQKTLEMFYLKTEFSIKNLHQLRWSLIQSATLGNGEINV